MVNKQGVDPFNICLFFSSIHLLKKKFLFFYILLYITNIQDALFLKKGKTRTCFSVVSLVFFSFYYYKLLL